MKGTTFKELVIALLSLSLVFIFGCSENNPINQPDDEVNSSVTQSVTAEPNWFKLPKFISKGLNKGTGFSVTKMVKANKNTKMSIKDDFEGPNGKVKVDIKIDFKKGTVPNDTEITMTFNTENGVLTFSPHMIFNKDAQLELKYDGLDLDGVEEGDINFLYLAPDGNYEPIDKTKIKIKVKNGELSLKHGKIPHFSRYGFIR